MLNIAIPLVGKSQFFKEEEYIYPKPLIEICGKPMIQKVIANLNSIECEKQFIFILNREDCSKYYLDNVVTMLAGDNCKTIILERATKGAACSVLMAIDFIDNDNPLVIANADQLFDVNLNEVIGGFVAADVDAGVICFNSVHPRWSFVRLDADQNIIEAAEKRPISSNAIAGFYYFRAGSIFIEAAKFSIKKGSHLNGAYYIAPVLNELVLKGRKLGISRINNESYHTFYTPQKIKEYEQRQGQYGNS